MNFSWEWAHPALLLLLLGLLLFETGHTWVANRTGHAGDTFRWVLAIDGHFFNSNKERRRGYWKVKFKVWEVLTCLYWRPLACSSPLGAMSGLLRAPWMISWASVFLAFRMSMVSFSSVSSESWQKWEKKYRHAAAVQERNWAPIKDKQPAVESGQ